MSVHPQDLEHYLHQHIPLSRAMQVTVASLAEDTVVLRAPLEPNINHRETVFGGSASAVALLAGWSLLYVRLEQAGVAARLVIQRNSMQYLRPIDGPFTARAALPEPSAWRTFLRTMQRRGRARIAVVAALACAGQVAGRFSGEFVALGELSREARA